jgi:hypothetical protein
MKSKTNKTKVTKQSIIEDILNEDVPQEFLDALWDAIKPNKAELLEFRKEVVKFLASKKFKDYTLSIDVKKGCIFVKVSNKGGETHFSKLIELLGSCNKFNLNILNNGFYSKRHNKIGVTPRVLK